MEVEGARCRGEGGAGSASNDRNWCGMRQRSPLTRTPITIVAAVVKGGKGAPR